MESTDGDVICRKTIKLSKHDELDQILIKKIQSCDPSIKASTGWLDKFENCHGIKQLSVEGETLSANSAVVSECVNKLQAEIKNQNLTLSQVYNCDETELNWKALPQKTLGPHPQR
ncbi:hypothetical protein NQ314_019295 [Rhamnusium bicolor]|uniref:Transposase n=1 Tax=Rhamnusium bicolor TaxID=1586634 RepID=A0AAV8WP04_9CUCU|nr:hypothetical protein NQ314_019295 [Rhamnusium bicolor]